MEITFSTNCIFWPQALTYFLKILIKTSASSTVPEQITDEVKIMKFKLPNPTI